MKRGCPRAAPVLVAIPGPSEAESFQLEMSGLMAELACPYSVLVVGDITQRFLDKDDCLLLLSMALHTFARVRF